MATFPVSIATKTPKTDANRMGFFLLARRRANNQIVEGERPARMFIFRSCPGDAQRQPIIEFQDVTLRSHGYGDGRQISVVVVNVIVPLAASSTGLTL
jgi:hypothetical protein